MAAGCRAASHPRGPVGPARHGHERRRDFPDDRGWGLDSLTMTDADGDGRPQSVGRLPRTTRPSSTPTSSASRPREALAMDPQQRLLLECRGRPWSGPGSTRCRCAASDTGVFTGRSPSRLRRRPAERRRARTRGTYALTGSAASVVSGRVAYALGLEGPAVTLDTACSSSLVALHWACQVAAARRVLARAGRRRHRACRAPGCSWSSARQGGLAADGRCKAFSDDADGTGWSEGVGVLVVERLSDARAQRPRGARGRARLRGQPGRRLQRPDRAERPLAAAGDPPRRWPTPG